LRRMLMSSSMSSSTGFRFFALRRIQTNASRRLSRAFPFIFFFLLMLHLPCRSRAFGIKRIALLRICNIVRRSWKGAPGRSLLIALIDSESGVYEEPR
jgi:hypothetical protein